MRNLIIDIGNTNTKFGIFENNQLKKQGVIPEVAALQEIVAAEKPENIALASVGISGEEVLKTLSVPGKKVAVRLFSGISICHVAV